VTAVPSPQRILVVDDEPQIARVLKTGLTSRGYETRAAPSGGAALETIAAWPPDLVITDLSMPDMDGVALCRAIRAASSVPIIVLSVRGEERSKVEALDAGADDYVTKPFGLDELLARIRAALRRGATVSDSRSVFDVGDFHVDVEAHVVSVRGQPVRLTPKEFDLLVYLARNWGKVVTHEALLGTVWGVSYAKQVEYLRVFVGQLRKKIEPDPGKPRYLLTEPWIGYRFEPGG
jgi:two-component system, OmpR family, KDP operon response regulator KdpE